MVSKSKMATKKEKILFLLPKWTIFNGFQNIFLRFVRPTSVYKKPLSLTKFDYLESKMAMQIDKIDLYRKIDFFKTAYSFADPTYFFKSQTLKCFPRATYIPCVFVCGVSSK
jgi:hypothetical protein